MNEFRRIQVVTSARNPSLPYMLQGIAAYARIKGNWSASLRPTEMPNLLADVEDADADGIVLCVDDAELAMAVAEFGKPVVSLHHRLPREIAPCILVNDQQIGTVGAEHLIEQGFQSFGFCGYDEPWSHLREKGFAQTVRETAMPCRLLALGTKADDRPNWATAREDEEPLREWLRKLKRPAAVMCADDPLASYLVNVCRRAGMETPAEIAVLGVGNVEMWCEFAEPSLSSVDPNTARLGRDGAELLDSLMEGAEPPQEPVIVEPLGVRARESTYMQAPDDELVSTALEFIRDNIDSPIGVEDILAAVPASRSSLQRRFRETLGRSPGEEIRRLRLERVRDLVVNTNMPLAEIAEASGFEYISHLCKAFKNTYGMSPKQYRQHHRGFSSALIPLNEIDPEALAAWRALDDEGEED